MFTDPPGAPEAPKVSDIFKDHCTLTWEPPAEDGGSPILGYNVERAMGGSTRWLKVSSQPFFTGI